MLPLSYRLYFWGVHGVFAEIVFTGLWDFVVSHRWSLMGATSIWSFLIYGFGSLAAERLYYSFHSRGMPLLVRGAAYVMAVYAWELSCGLLLDCFGGRGWDYTSFSYNFMGIITLEYAPLWLLGGLYFEFLMRALSRLEVKPLWKLRLKNS
ncbi:transmembrane protein 229B-like [Halichondria panicea]|uniref:transmembrane protein 229B-like n=1 Tax=Halichondria panicea TaxID=6063 RepID=UPI00312B6E3F